MREMLELLPEHSMLSRLFSGDPFSIALSDVRNIGRSSHAGQQEFLTQGGLAVLASALADEAAGREKVIFIIRTHTGTVATSMGLSVLVRR